MSDAPSLESCRIDEIAVCDKTRIDPFDPYEDLAYLPVYNYHVLDGTGLNIAFDSSSSAAAQTGEVKVIKRIQITNATSSVDFWKNDTIEAYRACPQYGSGKPSEQFDVDHLGGIEIEIHGKNFYDTGLNFCKFRTCISANQGRHPRRCKNQLLDQFGNDLPIAGEMSANSYISKAVWKTNHTMTCYIPEFLFESIEDFSKTIEATKDVTFYTCEWIHHTGLRITQEVKDLFPSDDTTWVNSGDYRDIDGNLYPDSPIPSHLRDDDSGNYSYVRPCYDPLVCMDKPEAGYEYFVQLVIPCHVGELFDGVCTNNPEVGYFFNPCISAEVAIEVTNHGEHYSGGIEMGGQMIR